MLKKLSFLLFFALPLLARQPYHATVTVGPASAHVSAPNLVDLKRDLSTASLELLIPFYTPATPASLGINLRGIQVLAAFPINSTSLVVQIPQAGLSQTFTGATRDDSITLFKDFIRDGGTHHRLLRAYARYSPIDPIAGNPNSLQALMGQSDYLLGELTPLTGCDSCWEAQPIVHQFQAGLNYGRAFSHGFDTTTVTLPLRYSYCPDLAWAFIIDAPLTYIRNGGASSLVGSVGLGLRIPINYAWSLTPILRGGSGGSLDLCTSGSFASAGVTSFFHWKFSNYVLGITNYAGYISSTNLWLSGVNFNYHLHNGVFKNGLSLTTCDALCLFERPVNFKLYFEDTYFAKEHLYMHHFDEIGFSVITNDVNPCLDYDSLSLGFTYQFGNKHYRGYYLTMVYQF